MATQASIHPVVRRVTERIAERSEPARRAYLDRIRDAAAEGPVRAGMPCSNLAHGFAACSGSDRIAVRGQSKPGVAIVSAYNDMLSAHQPYEQYPAWIKDAVREAGGVAQFAGGVPAMCDGITQGRTGMELSLFSRDVIAMATGVALSHEMFDAAVLLGVCDKIVPGLLIGALAFGHLPTVLVPAGPMTSGLPNSEKSRIRQLFAEGKATRDDLLDAAKAIHDFGPEWVLIKSGHLPDDPECVDLLFDGETAMSLPGPRYSIPHTHGAGDVFASSITAALAKGASMPDAVRAGKRFVTRSVAHAYSLGAGFGPVSTFWRVSPRSF